MTELPAPLTPADCDLRDFQFIPVDVQRLLSSETWVLGTLEERAAAMTLWLASWHQVPSGSIPKDDRMLAHLSQAGPKWKKVKEHSLRGWIEADDGRLYHPVVAEKALEAWVEKLSFSLSGSTGNAKRWGVSVDTGSTREQALTAIRMLRALAPQSKTLKKKAVAVIESGSRTESGGDHENGSGGDGKPSGGESGGESGGDRKGQGQGQGQGYLKTKKLSAAVVPATTPTAAPDGTRIGELCRALRAIGINAAPGQFLKPEWGPVLDALDNDFILAEARAKRDSAPHGSITAAYLLPGLVDRLKPRNTRPGQGHAGESARDRSRRETLEELTGDTHAARPAIRDIN